MSAKAMVWAWSAGSFFWLSVRIHRSIFSYSAALKDTRERPTWREMRYAAQDGRGDVARRLELRHERSRAGHHGSHLDHWVYD